MGNVKHIGQRSLGASIQLPASVTVVLDAFGLPPIDLTKDRISFSFHRRRRDGVWGWAIHLHVANLTICSPWTEDLPFPRHRRDAELWVIAFAEKHGIEPMRNVELEMRRKRYRADAAAEKRRSALRLLCGAGESDPS